MYTRLTQAPETERERPPETYAALYALRSHALWNAFVSGGFAYWMCCAYLFFEYVRPQSIWPILSFYPYWGRTFVVLALFGWLLTPKRKLTWTWATTGVFVFLGAVILSSMLAYWPEVSWIYFMDYFNWVVIFFVLTQIVITRSQFLVFLLIFFLASFKLSFFGARTWTMRGFSFTSWGISGPEGYFQNSGELAIQMLVFAPLALYFCLAVSPYVSRWLMHLLLLMPITAAMTVLGASSRGGQLALAVQVAALTCTLRRRFRAFLLVALIGAIGFHLLPEEQKERFSTAGEDNTSVQRLLYWQNGWQMIKDHPFFGVGYFNFSPYYTRYYHDDLSPGSVAELPHNIFVQVGTDTGFIGLGIVALLIATAFTAMRRIGREATTRNDRFVSYIATGMNLSLLGFLVAGQFVTVMYYPFFWIHLAFVTMLTKFWSDENARANTGLRKKHARYAKVWQSSRPSLSASD